MHPQQCDSDVCVCASLAVLADYLQVSWQYHIKIAYFSLFLEKEFSNTVPHTSPLRLQFGRGSIIFDDTRTSSFLVLCIGRRGTGQGSGHAAHEEDAGSCSC